MGIGAHRLSPCTLSLNVTCKNGQPLYKNVVRGQGSARHSSQFKNNHCTETCSGSRFSPCTLSLNVTCTYGGVISKLVISYIRWELITPVIRLITFRADDMSGVQRGFEMKELRDLKDLTIHNVQRISVEICGLRFAQVLSMHSLSERDLHTPVKGGEVAG